jgi:hypothetical protein
MDINEKNVFNSIDCHKSELLFSVPGGAAITLRLGETDAIQKNIKGYV